MSRSEDHDDGSATFARVPNELKLMFAEKLGIHDVNALARTCREMNELLTRSIYQRGKDTEAKSGRPYFLLAVDGGNMAAVALFVEVGADVNIRGSFRRYQQTAIHSCAHLGHVDIARFLIGEGFNVSAADKADFGVFHSLVRSEDPKEAMATLLIEAGFDLEARFISETPLHHAASDGKVRIVQHLLDLGADSNAADMRGARPVHLAAAHGNPATIQCLLRALSNVEIANDDSQTPLHYAARHGSADNVKLLLEMGAEVSSADSQGWTPLHIAVHAHATEATLHRILQFDASKTYQCVSRCRISETNDPKLEMLLAAGADIAQSNIYGRSPLTWAREWHTYDPERPAYPTYE